MISDEERYAVIFEVAEAGALIQRHLGDGAIHEVIAAADSFIEAHTAEVDDAELADPDDAEAWESTTRAAFIVGFSEGVSWKAVQDNPPIIAGAAQLRAVA